MMNYLCCNLRDFSDKIINDSDLLYLLAVRLFDLARWILLLLGAYTTGGGMRC